MREWVPISTSPKGRLAVAAVTLFGSRAFEEVTVTQLAASAEVTTGALYHHFDSKLGLYAFVRRDVERRLLDRMEGAAEADGADPLAAALLVGFGYAVRAEFVRLLSEPALGATPDPVAELFGRLRPDAGPAFGAMVAAAWRACLAFVADGGPPEEARAAITSWVHPESAAKH